jgi:putative aldouronate transport system substrate-binding protein
MKKKKVLTALAALLAVSTLTLACSKQEATTEVTTTPATSATTSAGTYPVKTDVTLSYWTPFNTSLNNLKSDYTDVPFYMELQKRTGIKLKYTLPPVGQEKETLNVLLASGDIPDIIEYSWKDFPGGPEKAINDGYILKLNDLIDQYAPNLKKFLSEHPEIDKQVKTDSGAYYVFPFVRGDESLKTFHGPMVRKDWLDELGLPVPTTIDEWYTMLTAFKEKKGAVAPLTINKNSFDPGNFVGAWGTYNGFYHDDGKVKYGPMDSQYKDFLTTMRKWYVEGLIDKNFATADQKVIDANITTDKSGAANGNLGGGIGRLTPPLQANDPKGILAPAPYPALNKGEKSKFGQKDFDYTTINNAAISGSSKNAEMAVRLLDYGYSPEGSLFYNFGIEGTSYTMVNGNPQYTELILNNPDKLAPGQVIGLYARGNFNGPFVQNKLYIEQFNKLQEQKDALNIWPDTDAAAHLMPPITPTVEESAEFATIMNDVNTLASEMMLKIILGNEPPEAFDKYTAKFKSLKIDRAIEIQQAALDRYNKR